MMFEGEICERFKISAEGIRPIIFSHGLMSQPADYIGISRDLASHGYIVISLKH